MKAKVIGGTAALVAIGMAAAGAATGSGSTAKAPSRLDDGKQYLSQAKVTEEQAIAAAQRRASGDLNEVDLEQASGRLVWNVDVGPHDVKVDAASGDVVSVDGDD
jgi:uncharacterized membrane protein YkoI